MESKVKHILIDGFSFGVEFIRNSEIAPNIVFLHGFMGSAQLFKPLLLPLSNYNHVLIDLPGHGVFGKKQTRSDFNHSDFSRALGKLISDTTNGYFTLYGYSMGARLALQFTLTSGIKPTHLILESGTAGLEIEQDRSDRVALDEVRAKSIEVDFEGFIEDWKTLPVFSNQESSEELMGFQKLCAPSTLADWLRKFGTGTMENHWPKLSTLEIPTLLIAGEKDEKFEKIAHRMQKLLPHSNIEIIPKAGHRCHVEQPESTSNVISEFIPHT